MRADKHGKYRVNFYLNPENDKDKLIIEYLKARYSPNEYMKELLFSIATGSNINNMSVVSSNMNTDPTGQEEYEPIEYEPIEDIENIDL